MNRIVRMGSWIVCLGLCLSAGTSCGSARADEEKKAPVGWIVAGSSPADYEMTSDSKVVHSGHESGHIRSNDKPDGFGTLMERFDASAYRGKRLRLAAFVKSQDVKGWAGVWMRVDGPESGKSLAFDNMQQRAIRGTSDWTRYEVVLDVPDEATAIAFGVLLTGAGEVWIDDSSFEVVDETVPTTDLMKAKPIAKEPQNLDFEQ